ncbi:MAG: sigma-70 family RNA polymerase sigma factor, partial [Planctomycetaceae bacterium]|nr:sigma-70 family RNA polymerase sigma factor [Planctomycetaceae bacterium]
MKLDSQHHIVKEGGQPIEEFVGTVPTLSAIDCAIYDLPPKFRKFPLDDSRSQATSIVTMEQNEPTDAELVAHTLSSCRESYGQLYDRYAHVVRAVFRSIGFTWTEVDDLTQECFLRAFRKLRSLRDPDKFGAWISGMARLIAREQRRSRVRDRHKFAGEVEPSLVDPVDFTSEVQISEEILLMHDHHKPLPAEERL